ncbi:organomercurial lyase [Streptomyces sp. NPDC002561]|uniref:organomercurial lyase n=1 Tax=unclassified Streptomyces TaxID=2593676 RepID=UPI00332FE273
MRITVLTVPDCPNDPLAQERIAAALEGRAAEVELVEVRDEAEAARWGMSGSPTVLLDGVDPFAPAAAAPSVSCRLYRDADGTVSGAPSVAALRQALAGADIAQPVAVGDCCPSEGFAVVGRGGRGRRAPAGRGLRAVHQAVLRHFAATGIAPEPDELEAAAASAGRTAGQVLEELFREDFLTLDEHGRIRAAYPFSAVPTRHRVRITGGIEAWSMCAIDALGIPPMLGQDAVITSLDLVTEEAVTVTATSGLTVWEPADAVVFVGQRPGGGPAATTCCDALNFFTSNATAHAWAKAHPTIPGRIVGQQDAEKLATQTFGPLLAP